jgi:XisI protein
MPALPGKLHGPGAAVMEDDPMATIEKYRACIQRLLTDRTRKGGDQGVEAQTIFDTVHDHYQLLYNGWHNTRRIFGPVLHLDIKDGKIWIH